ncbi:hypothetical protein, partial [Mycobacterium intracellulare]|uniref:hypothetical protein n=1 Tax=Mycobacterium intracellulare TaxID=1767 RepID=UPI001CD9B22A
PAPATTFMLNRSTIAISANSPSFTLSYFRNQSVQQARLAVPRPSFTTGPIVSSRHATRATPHRAVSKW